jgi:aspartate ammonia-lyase
MCNDLRLLSSGPQAGFGDIKLPPRQAGSSIMLNAFEPIMGWSLFKRITHLSNACPTLNANCVAGIEENRELLARRVREPITLVKALNPVIGYEKASPCAARTDGSENCFRSGKR